MTADELQAVLEAVLRPGSPLRSYYGELPKTSPQPGSSLAPATSANRILSTARLSASGLTTWQLLAPQLQGYWLYDAQLSVTTNCYLYLGITTRPTMALTDNSPDLVYRGYRRAAQPLRILTPPQGLWVPANTPFVCWSNGTAVGVLANFILSRFVPGHT